MNKHDICHELVNIYKELVQARELAGSATVVEKIDSAKTRLAVILDRLCPDLADLYRKYADPTS